MRSLCPRMHAERKRHNLSPVILRQVQVHETISLDTLQPHRIQKGFLRAKATHGPRRVGFAVVLTSRLIPLLFAAPVRQAAPPAQGKTTAVANLRAGPGSNFAKVGSLPAGQTVTISTCNKACDWYQLDSGAWIAAFLVDPVDGVPAAGAPLAPQATAVTTRTGRSSCRRRPVLRPAQQPPPRRHPQPGGRRPFGQFRTRNSSLRPLGTNYARVGGVQAGQALDITGG